MKKARREGSTVAPKKKASTAVAAPLSEAEQAFVAEYSRHRLAVGPRRPPSLVDQKDPLGGPTIITFDATQDGDLFRAQLAAVTGSPHPAAQTALFVALYRVCNSKESSAEAVTA